MLGPCLDDPVLSRCEEDTEAFGRRLATGLAGGERIALHGDLGAGKTVFARGLARGLGIEEPVTSPTFTIVQEYTGQSLRFYHIDLYRLNTADEAFAFGLDDFLDDEAAVTAIEWPERMGDELDADNVIHIDIRHCPEGRQIKVLKTGAHQTTVTSPSNSE